MEERAMRVVYRAVFFTLNTSLSVLIITFKLVSVNSRKIENLYKKKPGPVSFDTGPLG
tara:strand:+ start:185 stop:358 length:174 start_codon:yes stop_codon:yes gene_type:complete